MPRSLLMGSPHTWDRDLVFLGFGHTPMGDGDSDNLQVREAFADTIGKCFTFTTMVLSTCHRQVFVLPRESIHVILLRGFKSIIYANNGHFWQTKVWFFAFLVFFSMQSKPHRIKQK